MSLTTTPSSLLARLEELKKWQIKQQERLLQQQLNRISTTNLTSNYDTIEGLSELNSSPETTKSTLNKLQEDVLVERDINIEVNKKNSPPIVTFKERHEYIDGENDKNKTSNVKVLNKPKQPFLKRGSGLIRFKMNPGDQKRQFNNNINKKSVDNQCLEWKDIEIDHNIGNITPLTKPNLNIKPVWVNVSEENGNFQQGGNKLYYDHDSLSKQTINRINQMAAEKLDIPVTRKDATNYIDNRNEVINHGNCEISEEINKKSQENFCDRSVDRELLIFEALEAKALNSSFGSTNSSVLHILASTPSKIKEKMAWRKFEEESDQIVVPKDFQTQTTPGIMQDNQKLIEDDVIQIIDSENSLDDFHKSSKINSLESSVTSEDFQKELEGNVENIEYKDDQEWTDVNTYTRENSSLSSASERSNFSEKEVTLISDRDDIESKSCQTVENGDCIDENVLVKKVKELDDEIQSFRKENAKLKKVKYELEKEQMGFKKEKKAFEKYVLEQKINVEFHLEEEKKQLRKEKMVFERYVKDAQNKTTRKEREEISALKEELANLRETSKLKDTRNATSQARLRNQIKSFEKELVNLKDELEKLRKQNAKLTSTQKLNRKSSDTKMLQEINKNLSKLTNDNKVVGKMKKVEDGLNKKKDMIEALENMEINRTRNNTDKKEDVEKETCQNYDYFLKDHKNKDDIDIVEKSDASSNESLRVETNISLERSYEKMFGNTSNQEFLDENSTDVNQMNNSLKETTLSDGTKQITYPNGNIKIISPDGNFITVKYYNGDIKETKLLTGEIRYFYTENHCWQTNFANGDEVLEYENGQIEKKLTDGTIEIKFPNGILKIAKSDGSESISYPDSTRVDIDNNGVKIITFGNGQREIHTAEHMQREYPDGTVKIVYNDGIQETRYSNGRIRIKDKNGKLLLDSHEDV